MENLLRLKKRRAIHFISQWKSKRELKRKFWNFSINMNSGKIEFYCSFPPQIYLMQIPSLNWNMNGNSLSRLPLVRQTVDVCFETQMNLILFRDCLHLTAALLKLSNIISNRFNIDCSSQLKYAFKAFQPNISCKLWDLGQLFMQFYLFEFGHHFKLCKAV